MSVSPARKIAFDILRRVESEGAYASDALHEELHAGITKPDAALATEITMGVLRWQAQLDFLLNRHLKKPAARLDLPVAIALRMGIYQMRFLQRVPTRAAIYESVEIAKRAKKASAAPLVNAVLRKASAESATPLETFLPPNLPLAERLVLLHSHPAWLVERWLARFGDERTTALLQANNTPPLLSCFAADPGQRSAIIGELSRGGLKILGGRLLRDAFSVNGGPISRTRAFAEGYISIQDEASQAIPLLLATESGDRILDLCAAPGGKTAILARRVGKTGAVIAADLYPHRLLALRAQMQRLGLLDNVRVISLNAEQALPLGRRFTRILVDAPCSGTGTLARHPEIRWRLQPSDLAGLHAMQVKILRNALSQLAPGGRLVYSTCSMEPEENEDVVAEILHECAEDPVFTRVPRAETMGRLVPYLAPGVNGASLFDSEGQFRTLPGRDQADGFFAVVLERKADSRR